VLGLGAGGGATLAALAFVVAVVVEALAVFAASLVVLVVDLGISNMLLFNLTYSIAIVYTLIYFISSVCRYLMQIFSKILPK
jgi:hypothetical protein